MAAALSTPALVQQTVRQLVQRRQLRRRRIHHQLTIVPGLKVVDEVHEERRLAERSHPTRRTTSPARVLGVGRSETGHPVVGHDCVRQRLSALAQSVEQEQRAAREQRGWEQFARGTTCGVSRVQQKSSEAIRSPQRPSEVIRGHQRSSEAIRGPQRSPVG